MVNESKEAVTVKGDSSVFTMDLALDFIRQQASEKKPFFAYVCFGSPHGPFIPAEEFKKLYEPDEAGKVKGYNIDYLAEVTGVDAAVGRLCEELKKLGLAEDTIVWFTSDNGSLQRQSNDPTGRGKDYIGTRTVACMEWPGRFKEPIRAAFPCLHQDMLPTLIAAAGSNETPPNPLDGINLIPMLEGKVKQREKPMGFLLNHKKDKSGPIDFGQDMQSVWLDWPYKLVLNYQGGGSKRAPLIPLALYHLENDPSEKTDVAATNAERVSKMRQELEVWQRSVRESNDGKDYRK
jgi:arylsulfatase A-like enzyme